MPGQRYTMTVNILNLLQHILMYADCSLQTCQGYLSLTNF